MLEANVAGTGFNLNAEKLYIWVKWAPNLAFFAARFLLSSRLTLDMVCYRHGRNGLSRVLRACLIEYLGLAI
jgi:hypothetical protein